MEGPEWMGSVRLHGAYGVQQQAPHLHCLPGARARQHSTALRRVREGNRMVSKTLVRLPEEEAIPIPEAEDGW